MSDNHLEQISHLYWILDERDNAFLIKHYQLPDNILNIIPKDADLSMIMPKFVYWLLINKDIGMIRYAELDNTKKTIKQTADLIQKYIDGEKLSRRDQLKAISDYQDPMYSNDAGMNAALQSDKKAYFLASNIASNPFDHFANLFLLIDDAIMIMQWNYAAHADGYKEIYNNPWEATEAAQEVARYCPVRKEAYRAYAKKLLELLKETQND